MDGAVFAAFAAGLAGSAVLLAIGARTLWSTR